MNARATPTVLRWRSDDVRRRSCIDPRKTNVTGESHRELASPGMTKMSGMTHSFRDLAQTQPVLASPSVAQNERLTGETGGARGGFPSVDDLVQGSFSQAARTIESSAPDPESGRARSRAGTSWP